jgi:glyoxylase-like metal-dependent hydrolase (beta-lactamase superfamily II)
MRAFALSLVVLVSSLGCADVSAIEDGKAFGPVVTILDLFTSCYVLDAGDELVVFDSCWREGTLVDGLRSQGFAPEQVTHVLMTHGHQDHAGGLRALPNAEVLGFDAEQSNLTEHAESAGQIDRALTDGEQLTFGEHTVDVLAAFGHSPGSAVYVVGGTALIGDVGLVTADGHIAPAPEDRSEDPAEAARALGQLDERLLALDQRIDFIVPSHSGAVEGLDALEAFQPPPG